MTRRVTARLLVALAVALAVPHSAPSAYQAAAAVRFAVIGDFGTGSPPQYELAKVMADEYARTPFGFAITVGDNIYGGWSRRAVAERFERPYKTLLDAGVLFYASLGNHDGVEERQYEPFHMQGQRYYTFRRSNVDFFALDSNYLDPGQVEWLRSALGAATADWKIAYFHHPLYSSGARHGSSKDLRAVLEPLFLQFGVQAVFSGHDHVYERVRPQRGVAYFVCGSSGQLRRGNLDRTSPLTAAGYDQDLAFMVIDIDGDRLRFNAISRTAAIVDAGEIRR